MQKKMFVLIFYALCFKAFLKDVLPQSSLSLAEIKNPEDFVTFYVPTTLKLC